MDHNVFAYMNISDVTKQTYCPRQVFGGTIEFNKSEFFVQYCANIPCRGDIRCNRRDCWEMLMAHGPYVQKEKTNASQQAVCPSLFFGRLLDYVHDSGIAPNTVFDQAQLEFFKTNFALNKCNVFSCTKRRLLCPTINKDCWEPVLNELKSQQR